MPPGKRAIYILKILCAAKNIADGGSATLPYRHRRALGCAWQIDSASRRRTVPSRPSFAREVVIFAGEVVEDFHDAVGCRNWWVKVMAKASQIFDYASIFHFNIRLHTSRSIRTAPGNLPLSEVLYFDFMLEGRPIGWIDLMTCLIYLWQALKPCRCEGKVGILWR